MSIRRKLRYVLYVKEASVIVNAGKRVIFGSLLSIAVSVVEIIAQKIMLPCGNLVFRTLSFP